MGASQGIGKAIAQSLIGEGVQVILSSRNENNLKQAQKELGAQGYYCADTTLEGEGKKL